ncbi:hypothetical protein RFI_25924, partial [Reticulomyxa filosa]
YCTIKWVGPTPYDRSVGSDDNVIRVPGTSNDATEGFVNGTTVGIGLNFESRQVFFTLNGVLVKEFIVEHYYPTEPMYIVGFLREFGNELQFNFGQKKFLFNLDLFFRLEKFKARQLYGKYVRPIMSYQHYTKQHQVSKFDDIAVLIEDHLLHSGYVKTLEALRKRRRDTLSNGGKSIWNSTSVDQERKENDEKANPALSSDKSTANARRQKSQEHNNNDDDDDDDDDDDWAEKKNVYDLNDAEKQEIISNTQFREQVLVLIGNGKCIEALKKIQSKLPTFEEKYKGKVFLLKVFQLISLLYCNCNCRSIEPEHVSTTFVIDELNRYRYEDAFVHAIEHVLSMWTLWKGIEYEMLALHASSHSRLSNSPSSFNLDFASRVAQRLPANFQYLFGQEFKLQLIKQIDVLLRNELKKQWMENKLQKMAKESYNKDEIYKKTHVSDDIIMFEKHEKEHVNYLSFSNDVFEELRLDSNQQDKRFSHYSQAPINVIDGGESKLVSKLKWLSTIHTIQREHCAYIGEKFAW